MELFAPIVGTHFRGSEAKRIVNDLVVGEISFDLIREPENEYDFNAVAVYYDDIHIGYIAATHNRQIADHLDTEGDYRCEVVDFDGRKPILLVELLDA